MDGSLLHGAWEKLAGGRGERLRKNGGCCSVADACALWAFSPCGKITRQIFPRCRRRNGSKRRFRAIEALPLLAEMETSRSIAPTGYHAEPHTAGGTRAASSPERARVRAGCFHKPRIITLCQGARWPRHLYMSFHDVAYQGIYTYGASLVSFANFRPSARSVQKGVLRLQARFVGGALLEWLH